MSKLSVDDISKWSIDRTAEWLVKVGFSDYTAGFISREINGRKLLAISAFEVKSIFKSRERESTFWRSLEELKNSRSHSFEEAKRHHHPKQDMFGNRGYQPPPLPPGQRGTRNHNFNRPAPPANPTGVGGRYNYHQPAGYQQPPPPAHPPYQRQQPTLQYHQTYPLGQQGYDYDDDDDWDSEDSDSQVYLNEHEEVISSHPHSNPPPPPRPARSPIHNSFPENSEPPPRPPPTHRIPNYNSTQPRVNRPENWGNNAMARLPPNTPTFGNDAPPQRPSRSPNAGEDVYLEVDKPSETEVHQGRGIVPSQRQPAFLSGMVNDGHQPAAQRPYRLPQLMPHPEEPQKPYTENIESTIPSRRPPMPPPSDNSHSPSTSLKNNRKSPGPSSGLSRESSGRGSSGYSNQGDPRRAGSRDSQGSSSSGDHIDVVDSPRKEGGNFAGFKKCDGRPCGFQGVPVMTKSLAKQLPTMIEKPQLFNEKPPVVDKSAALSKKPELPPPRKSVPPGQLTEELENVFSRQTNHAVSGFSASHQPRRISEPVVTERRMPSVSEAPVRPPSQPASRQIDEQPWYRNSSRSDAQSMIEQNPQDGKFIVRPGRGADKPYSLTVYAHNEMFNLQVRCRPDGNYALGTRKENERSFPSAVDMIEYYMNVSLTLADGKGSVTLSGPP